MKALLVVHCAVVFAFNTVGQKKPIRLMAEAEDFGSSGGNECDRKAKAAEWRRKTQTGGAVKAIGGLGRAKLSRWQA